MPILVPSFDVDPTCEPTIATVKTRRFNVLDRIVANAAAQIQTDEDKNIFDMIDALGKTCQVKSHAAYGRSLEECKEIECVARHIHES